MNYLEYFSFVLMGNNQIVIPQVNAAKITPVLCFLIVIRSFDMLFINVIVMSGASVAKT